MVVPAPAPAPAPAVVFSQARTDDDADIYENNPGDIMASESNYNDNNIDYDVIDQKT